MRDGSIALQMDVERDTEFPFLPRFGIRMMLPRAMRNVVLRLRAGQKAQSTSTAPAGTACSGGIAAHARRERGSSRRESGKPATTVIGRSVAGDGVALIMCCAATVVSLRAQVRPPAIDYTAEEMTRAPHDFVRTQCRPARPW